MISREGLPALVQSRSVAVLPIPDLGHSYTVSYCLGEFSKVTPELLLDKIKAGQIFPLVIRKGNFLSEGQQATLCLPHIHGLKFVPFSENEVRVKKITKNGVELEALPNHVFEGTVFHKIEKCGSKVLYIIQGRGTPQESFLSRFFNEAFVKLHLWELFIKVKMIKEIADLESQLIAQEEGGEANPA